MRKEPSGSLRAIGKILRLMAFLAPVLLTASAASGDQDGQHNNSPGDIIVSVTGTDGSPVSGCRVRLILPGPDGSLDKAPNILFESTDGDKFDADGERNGAVAFAREDIKAYAAHGASVLLDISAAGHTPALDQERTYSGDAINIFEIQLEKENKTGK
jgi:hypothetical protein